MSRIGAGMANNLMDMEDGAYDYIMSALSDSIKNQLAASFECLSLDGIAVFNTSIEPILEMANENNHEFLRYFYHPDHLGSSSFITGATGEPTQHLEYLPFGELFIEERSTWNTPYKFSAKELDDETGYSYFGARYYDPNISIWLSVDPLSDKYPRYTPFNYTLNNPVKYTDPNGEFPILGTLVGAATGAIGEITSQTISYGLNNVAEGRGFFNNWSRNMDWADVGITTIEGAVAGTTAGVSLLATRGLSGVTRSAVDAKGDGGFRSIFSKGEHKKPLNEFGIDLIAEGATLGMSRFFGMDKIEWQTKLKPSLFDGLTEGLTTGTFDGMHDYAARGILGITKPNLYGPIELPGIEVTSNPISPVETNVVQEHIIKQGNARYYE